MNDAESAAVGIDVSTHVEDWSTLLGDGLLMEIEGCRRENNALEKSRPEVPAS
jgi:hypothetical protein